MKKYNRIAIEGGEGVGKSTVLNILKKNLDQSLVTSFVGGKVNWIWMRLNRLNLWQNHVRS